MGFWEEKVILITGGNSGIGKAAAKLFLEKGATVFILGRNIQTLNLVKDEMKANISTKIYTLCCDVSKVSECKLAIDTVINTAGKLDVLVNSAGISYSGSAVSMTEEMWDNTIDINLKGTFFMCQAAIPYLAKTEGGIVNVSSDAGIVGNRGLAIYCASKGGVSLLTKALALELAPEKIRVNAVCPGEVDTPMLDIDFAQSGFPTREMYDEHMHSLYPQGEHARYIKAEEVAQCIMFLADKEKVEAITGACMMVDFGITAGY